MIQGPKQVKRSHEQMQNEIMKTRAPINDIRVKNEQLQKNSKIFDERRAQQRLTAIQQQAVMSNKKNTALQIKWSQLKQYQQCQTLNKSIQEQKQAFQQIVAAKDKLIKQFQNQLKKKDDQYTKTLKAQGEDIKLLVAKMREQYFALRDQSLKQLDQIQNKFSQQRKEYIQNSKKQVQQCFRQHISMETDFSKNRKKAEEDFQKKIEELRIQGMQAFTSTKIRMENDIQSLQKCYQQMKALYQLNTQKLDYNLKVLKEKKQQNSHTHQDYKKKLRLHNIKLRNLRDEYQKADQAFKDQNKLLTTEYKRITRQFKQLQRKFKHFQKSDLQRYNEIQSMNEVQVHELKQKIIKCDIVIHNQQLGVDWAGTPQEQEKQKEKENVLGVEDDENQEVQLLVSEDKLMEMINILIEEADFIFDDKMREQLQRAGQQQKLKQKLDILKKTLQIDSTDQLNIFIDEMANRCKYISQKQKHAILEAKLKKQQEARQQEQRQQKKNKRRGVEEKKVEKPVEVQPPVEEQEPRVDLKSDFKVDSTLVVDFLVDWMNNRDQRKKMLQRTAKKSLKQLSQRQKKQRIAKQGKKYWQKLTQVLPERTFRIWKVLDKSFAKYYDLLLARQKLINETGQMHSQNQELKNLLNQYLQINHQLIIPPTRLMEREE